MEAESKIGIYGFRVEAARIQEAIIEITDRSFDAMVVHAERKGIVMSGQLKKMFWQLAFQSAWHSADWALVRITNGRADLLKEFRHEMELIATKHKLRNAIDKLSIQKPPSLAFKEGRATRFSNLHPRDLSRTPQLKRVHHPEGEPRKRQSRVHRLP